MNKIVVISGAADMTGSKSAEYLLKKGYKVIGFDNFFFLWFKSCYRRITKR